MQWEKIVGTAAFNCQVISQAKLFFNPLAKAQFIARSPAPKLVPEWYLTKALNSLRLPRFSEPPDITHKLKTLFLVALAAGGGSRN